MPEPASASPVSRLAAQRGTAAARRADLRQDYAALDAQARACIAALRGGDHAALGELATLICGRLYRYFQVRGFAHADAQDLVQETCLRAVRHLDRYDAGRPFLPWLFTIASRQAASQWRRRGAEELPDGLVCPAPLPGDRLERQDQARQLWATARAALRPPQYEAIWLHYGEGLSVADIATVMRRTPVSVKVLLHRGRRKLQHDLCRLDLIRTGGRQP